MISDEFKKVVEKREELKIKIILKDSLLLDMSFKKFEEMISFLNDNKIDIWDETEALDKEEKENWKIELMNSELVRLVENFSRERVAYIKEIIKFIYRDKINNLTENDNNIAVDNNYKSTLNKNNNSTKLSISKQNRDMSFKLEISKKCRYIKDILNNTQLDKNKVKEIQDYANMIVDLCRKYEKEN